MHFPKIFLTVSTILIAQSAFSDPCPNLAGIYDGKKSTASSEPAQLVIQQTGMQNFTRYIFTSNPATSDDQDETQSNSSDEIIDTDSTLHRVGNNRFPSFNFCRDGALWIATFNGPGSFLSLQQFTLHPTHHQLTISHWSGYSTNGLKQHGPTRYALAQLIKKILRTSNSKKVPLDIKSLDETETISDELLIYPNLEASSTILDQIQ